MEIYDSLSKNRSRTLLTAFGIFWGIFMLILLMGGGRGLQTMLSSNFAGFASNSGFFISETTSMPYKGFRKGRYWSLQVEDTACVRNAIAELDVVTPLIMSWANSASAENHSLSVSVQGEYPEYAVIDNPKITHGRSLNAVDNLMRRKVCVVGSRIVEELFVGKDKDFDPCGRFIQVDGIHYRIVGVSGKGPDGINIGGNAQTTVHLPYETMRRTYNRGSNIDVLCVTARPGYQMSNVQAKAERVLKRKHYIHPDDTQALTKLNVEAIFGMIDTLFNGVSILVWMIGLGTLLAGAIGVSNIMIVAVKERTIEIGIRRAIGATPYNILRMIMRESVVLTLLAGMSGITLAVLILQGVEMALHNSSPEAQFQISFGTALGAASLLALLGVIAGLAPAMRAMQIRPVDAMREE
ncbi:MAG: ABC transporter permease [Bacteroidaceae bacterium]|nr:ABC transporter permease [Bacteroidaceae bacterium]